MHHCPLLSLICCPEAIRQCAALLGQQPVGYLRGRAPSSVSSTVHKLTYPALARGHIAAQGEAETLRGHSLLHHFCQIEGSQPEKTV